MVRLKFAMMVLMAVATLKIWIQHQWPEFLPQNNSGMILSIVKMEVRNKIGSQCVRAVFSSPFYSPSSLHWGQQIFIGSQQPKVLPSERKRYQPPHLKTLLITKVYLESNHSQCLQIIEKFHSLSLFLWLASHLRVVRDKLPFRACIQDQC